MDRKKQLILAILLSVFLSALFSGCGTADSGSSETIDLTAHTNSEGSGSKDGFAGDTENGNTADAVPSGAEFVPIAAPADFITTEDGPLSPSFIEYDTPSWFNHLKVVTPENYPGLEGTVTNFIWEETGGGDHCLMILVDTERDHGGANYSLIVPGYNLPEIMKRGDYIYVTWEKISDPNDRIALIFIEGSNLMAITENALTGVTKEPDSDMIELAVPVYGTGEGCYYIPLYAIINQVGGGVMFDLFGEGKALIFTGDVLMGYTGFWEVADDTEYRVEVVQNGKVVDVGNYWWSLALRPDGTFTEYDQYYQDEGDWIKSEKNGEFAFFGRVLAMKYLTETEYRGKDLDSLEAAKINEPILEYNDGVALYVRYVEDWDIAEILKIRGYRVLYSHEMSGRTD